MNAPATVGWLWKDHYIAGETPSFHGDMARAFARMLHDPSCGERETAAIRRSIGHHCRTERLPGYEGRKWFCELFGNGPELNPDVAIAAGVHEAVE